MTSRKGLLGLIAAVLAFAPAASVRAADTVAPGSPADVIIEPATATTLEEFRLTWHDPEDESFIDTLHYTIGTAPTSNADGAEDALDSTFVDDSRRVSILAIPAGETELYFWLEDSEGNQDYTTAVLVKVSPEGATDELIRVAGQTRYESAVKISKKIYIEPQSANAVVIASGERVVDAMAGVALSLAAHGPILYSKRYEVPVEVWAEVQRVAPLGSTVYLLGSEEALDANQQAFFEANGYSTKRLKGRDRFATAVTIADEVNAVRGSPSDVIVFVNGAALADGLSVSPLISSVSGAVLLVERDEIPQRTLDYLRSYPKSVIYLIGGTSVIGEEIATQLSEENIFQFLRIGGRTRFDTSAILARFITDGIRPGIGVANAYTLADALPAGPHLAAQLFPLILVPADAKNAPCLPTTRFLEEGNVEIEGGYLYGGTQAITSESQDFLEQLISGQASAGC